MNEGGLWIMDYGIQCWLCEVGLSTSSMCICVMENHWTERNDIRAKEKKEKKRRKACIPHKYISDHEGNVSFQRSTTCSPLNTSSSTSFTVST